MNRFGLLGLACLAVTLLPLDGSAQSLWHFRDPYRVFLFSDTQASQVGDLLTVIIRENTDVENKDERALDKNNETGSNFDFSGNISGNGVSRNAAADFDTTFQSNRKFDGRSEFSVEQEFSDRITVQVLDKLPNGNLVIGGNRRRFVAGEVRSLVVSGIVRPLDIRADNTVQSQFVGNFKVCYEGAGPETAFSNQGWLSQIVNRYWPF